MGQSKKAGSLGSPLSNTKCVYTVDSPSQLLPLPGTLNKLESKIKVQSDRKDYLDGLYFLILSGKKCDSLGQTSSSAFALGRLAFMHAYIHGARQASCLCRQTHRHRHTRVIQLFKKVCPSNNCSSSLQ